MSKDIQKITVNVPSGLLAAAQGATGKGITETICEGLEAIRRREAYHALKKLRGTVDLSYRWQDLRAMDDEA